MNTETEPTHEELVQRRLKQQRAEIAQLSILVEKAEVIARKLPTRLLDGLALVNGGIILYFCDHESAMEVMRCLGAGRWTREVNASDPTEVDYTALIDGVPFSIYGATPPDSCRIVEEEIHVPAHTEKRRKLVCAGTSPDLLARASALEGRQESQTN